MKNQKTSRIHCQNCNSAISEGQKFCPTCGQKIADVNLSLIQFFKESINTIFNVENKFFQTVIFLFIPARLSIDFFNGVRKKYYHPFRIYFVSILMLFFALSIYTSKSTTKEEGKDESALTVEIEKEDSTKVPVPIEKGEANRTALQEQIDSLSVDSLIDEKKAAKRGIQRRFLKKNRVKRYGRRIVGISDYENRYVFKQKAYLGEQFDNLKTTSNGDTQLLDSIFNNLYFVIESDTTMLGDSSDLAALEMDLIYESVLLTFDEVNFINIDTVVANKNLVKWIDRLYLRRQLVLQRGNYNNALYSNLTWLLLALVPFHAWILYIFFFRKRKYFIEHYVFLLELYSAVIVFFVLLLFGLGNYLGISFILSSTAIFAIIFFLFSLRAYYKQKWWLIFLKSVPIGMLFFILALLALIVFALFVALFFK